MSKTFTVENAAELLVAIDSAAGGDRIELMSGNYGELFLKDVQFEGAGVTIASADANALAVFDKIHVNLSENLHFDQIEIDFDPVGNTGYEIGFRASEGAAISLTNSVLHGGVDPNREAEYADVPVGRGVQFFRVDDVIIAGNEIYDFHRGVSGSYADGVTIADNHVHDLRTTFLAGGALNNVTVSGNHLETSNPVNLSGPGDHANMLHFFSVSRQEGPMSNIIIRDNFMHQGEGVGGLLGIHLDDTGGADTDLGFVNVVIENNVLHNGNAQGVRAENVDGLVITNNSFLQSSGVQDNAPGIVLTRETQNIEIDGNIIAGSIAGTSTEDAGADLHIGDNLFVQNQNPFGENYVGALFFNGLTVNADLNDLMPLAGSGAQDFGATIGLSDLSGDMHVALIAGTANTGLDMKTINFEAQALYDSEGEIDLTNAEVFWDFGDGASDTGLDIAHTFDTAGTYDVTATFILENGDTIRSDKTIDVFAVEAVAINFDGDIQDSSDVANPVVMHGDIRLEGGRFGDAVRLLGDTSKVEVTRTEEILDNPEFSISFAFQKDGGTQENDDDGRLIYFARTASINTDDGKLTFNGKTSTGEFVSMSADVDQIEDGAWHHVSYTFSADAQRAVLYLDGTEVSRVENISGIQDTTNGHDLYIGGFTKGSFGGLIDEVSFLRTALTPQEVQNQYETLFNGQPTCLQGVTGPDIMEPDVAIEVAPAPQDAPEPQVLSSWYWEWGLAIDRNTVNVLDPMSDRLPYVASPDIHYNSTIEVFSAGIADAPAPEYFML